MPSRLNLPLPLRIFTVYCLLAGTGHSSLKLTWIFYFATLKITLVSFEIVGCGTVTQVLVVSQISIETVQVCGLEMQLNAFAAGSL